MGGQHWDLWQKVLLREECKKQGWRKDWISISKLVGKEIKQCRAMYSQMLRKPITDLNLVVDKRPDKNPDFSKFNIKVKD